MNKGKKFDAGKPRFSLVPPDALASVMQVLEFGAEKYGVDNWRKLDNLQQRYLDSTMRHIMATRKGELIDSESGLPHLAHAICGLMFMLEDMHRPVLADAVEPDNLEGEVQEKRLWP